METNGSIRVVIAHDYTLLREGLAHLLQRELDIEVVGETSISGYVVDAVKMLQPDLLLLGLTALEGDELEILPQCWDQSPATKVLILADHLDRKALRHILRKGTKGYFSIRMSSSYLPTAIRAVHSGEVWVKRSATSQLLEDLSRTAHDEPVSRAGKGNHLLSHREEEVAKLVATGYSNKEIATRLSISEKTVKTHLVNIFRKLPVNDRLQLALYMLHQQFPEDHKTP